MAAVWFFFALGIIAFASGAIVGGIWLFGIVASYIATAKDYVQKRIALRREKISELKLKDIEVKDNENLDIEKELLVAERTPEDATEEEANEIAKDILGK